MEMQAHMVLGLLIVSFAMQVMFQPYATPLVNSLESAALGVGRCRLTVSKPVLKALMLSALETRIS